MGRTHHRGEVRAPPGLRGKAPVRVITVGRERPCLTCEEKIEVGERANWEPGVGIWCLDCPPPDNLEHHIKDRERKKALGR
jgi:hypothetical protein